MARTSHLWEGSGEGSGEGFGRKASVRSARHITLEQ